MAPSAGVQLVDEKLCADDEMVNHEGFNSSFLEEFIMDAGDGTEDGKQHDGKFDHNPHTNVGCFYLFAHLRSVNYYRTHQDGQEDPQQHEAVDDDQCQAAGETEVQSGEDGEEDAGVDEDDEQMYVVDAGLEEVDDVAQLDLGVFMGMYII